MERDDVALTMSRNESRSRGTLSDLLCVMQLREGVIARYELFDVDDEDAARRRFDELAARAVVAVRGDRFALCRD